MDKTKLRFKREQWSRMKFIKKNNKKMKMRCGSKGEERRGKERKKVE